MLSYCILYYSILCSIILYMAKIHTSHFHTTPHTAPRDCEALGFGCSFVDVSSKTLDTLGALRQHLLYYHHLTDHKLEQTARAGYSNII